MVFQTANKFSGLYSYPNAISEVPPGALQLANNVVIDRPGVVSPRRGQRVYSLYEINLLTANQATGGDASVATTGFFIGELAAYNTPGTGALALYGPAVAPFIWQGAYAIEALGLDATPTTGICLLVALAAGTYTFSTYAREQGSNTNVQLKVIDSSSISLLSSSTPIIGSGGFIRISGTFTLASPGSVQIGLTLDVGGDNELFLDGLQLQAGPIATIWTPPGGLVCTRLFQVNKSVYGFFTADGLPTSPGSFFRVIDTTGGAVPPQAVSAPWSATPNYFFPPPANAVHELQTKNMQYYSTADGIMKLLADLDDDVSGSMVPAGMPFALDTRCALANPAAGALGFLAGGYATAYRVVWGNTDPQGNVTLGAPSPAVIIENPKLAKTAAVYAPAIPPTAGPNFPYVAYDLYVTLPFTASSTTIYRGVSVVQGDTVSIGDLYTLATSNIGAVIMTGTVHYFGPVGTPVTVVLPGVATAFSAPTITFASGFVQSPAWTTATPALTIFQPANQSNPASTAGATAMSVILTAPTATTVTVSTGVTFTPGPLAVLAACTVQTQQLNQIFTAHSGSTFTDPQAGDKLALPGVTGQVTVVSSSINATLDAGATVFGDVVNLTAFPEGLVLNGDVNIDVYRPKEVVVSFTVPQEAYLYTAASTGQATSAFYQVYRSYVQAQIIEGLPTEPTDVMQQCFQGEITGTSGATVISFTDIAPDATLGTEIYTSPQQPNGGILGALYQPPVASDMTLYQGSALYANCFLPATFSTQLLAVSSTNMAGLAALQPGDVISVNGTQFTATNSGSPTAQQFTISAGSGSVTTDTTTTVNNLARQVNKFYVAATDTNTALPIVGENVTLLGTSTPTSLGGNMSWRAARGVGKFTLEFIDNPTYPHSSPFVSLTSDVAVTVLPTEQQNAVFYSPAGEPEGVPLLNSINVAEANYEIDRILPLPGSCLVFKGDGKIAQLSGVTPAQFSVQLLHSSAQLLANESAVIMQFAVIAFTTQGITLISPSGIQVLSLAINDDLLALTELPAFASTAFGVAHEMERRYMLWAPTVAGDVLPTQAYSYNLITNAWSKWQVPRVCGLVNVADQLLYSGSALPGAVSGQPSAYREAADAGDLRYGDEVVAGSFTVTGARTGTLSALTAPAGTNVPASFGPGSALIRADGIVYPASIATASSTSVTLTFSSDLIVSNGAATLVQATPCQFATVPIVGDDAGAVKQFQEFVFSFVNTTCPNMTAIAATDFGQDATVLPLVMPGQQTSPLGGWGAGTWGSFVWGSGPAVSAGQPISARQLAPFGASRGHSFWPTATALVAANYFGAQGLTLAWTLMRTPRMR